MKEAMLVVTLAAMLGGLGWLLANCADTSLSAADLGDQALAAAERRDLPAVRKLLARIQAKPDSLTMGPLGLAIVNDRVELVQVLLDAGADVNAVYGPGLTPLMLAASSGDLTIVNLLLERGALVNAQSCEGNTALMIAAGFDSSAIVQRLLQANANPELRSSSDETALDMARLDYPGSRSEQILAAAVTTAGPASTGSPAPAPAAGGKALLTCRR